MLNHCTVSLKLIQYCIPTMQYFRVILKSQKLFFLQGRKELLGKREGKLREEKHSSEAGLPGAAALQQPRQREAGGWACRPRPTGERPEGERGTQTPRPGDVPAREPQSVLTSSLTGSWKLQLYMKRSIMKPILP